MKEEIIKDKKEEINGYLEKKKRISFNYSLARFVVFILAVVFLFLGIFIHRLFYLGTVLSVIIFIVLAVFHNKVLEEIDCLNYQIGALNSYLSRFDDSWKSIGDKGNDFLDKDSFYEEDLDIFGEASLFQYLSNAKTPYGRLYLSQSLKNPHYDNIDLRNEAACEMALKMDLSLKIDAASRMYAKSESRNKSVVKLERMDYSIREKVQYSKWYGIIAVLGSITLIVTTILAVFKILDLRIPVFALIFNFASIYLYSRLLSSKMNEIFEINQTLDSYIPFMEYINYDFNSELLNQYKNDLKKSNEALNSFHRRAGIINMRRNILFSLIGNGIFQFDFWCLVIYSSWQKKYSADVLGTLKTIGLIEEINSLATINRVKNICCKPVIGDNISFTNLFHPLISEEKGVGNSFTLDGLDIITGSNMSGKTTFMRTIGINMILFLAGAYTTGEAFSGKYVKIFTSMRATDDVSNGISTFYAEILRIKEILNYLKEKDHHILVLIDEIFKGTNTHDRIIGAKGVIDKLTRMNVLGIIATHDNELCDYVSDNYHFEEHYVGDEILFDYKIKKGIAITTNAKHLMRLAGIIDE